MSHESTAVTILSLFDSFTLIFALLYVRYATRLNRWFGQNDVIFYLSAHKYRISRELSARLSKVHGVQETQFVKDLILASVLEVESELYRVNDREDPLRMRKDLNALPRESYPIQESTEESDDRYIN